jgi:hypothetical protein
MLPRSELIGPAALSAWLERISTPFTERGSVPNGTKISEMSGKNLDLDLGLDLDVDLDLDS